MAQAHSDFGLIHPQFTRPMGTVMPGAVSHDSEPRPLRVRDTSPVESLEITVLWGSDVVHVTHLTPPRPFRIGESAEHQKVDFEVPRAKLGVVWHGLIGVDGGAVYVVVPGGSSFTSTADEHGGPCEIGADSRLEILGRDVISVSLGDLCIRVGAVAREKALPKAAIGADAGRIASYLGATMLGVGIIAGSLAYATPASGLVDDESIDPERLYLIQQYLKASAENNRPAPETENVRQDTGMGEHGNVTNPARGESGAMGKSTSRERNRRAGVEGPADNANPQLPSRSEVIAEARNYGLIGLLNSSAYRNAPTVPWGDFDARGNDEQDAMGNMFGATLGDAYGAGGLGLSGIGEGGGGRGDQIGIEGVSTCTGAICSGQGGYGRGSALGQRGHKTKVPPVRMGTAEVSGRLPREVIQRIVRQNYGRFRMCYEQGLARNPNLEGRVAVRFAIGSDGRVNYVSNGGSDLPDTGVVSCVLNAYYGLSFPQPEGGTVTVVYPIMFAPQ